MLKLLLWKCKISLEATSLPTCRHSKNTIHSLILQCFTSSHFHHSPSFSLNTPPSQPKSLFSVSQWRQWGAARPSSHTLSVENTRGWLQWSITLARPAWHFIHSADDLTVPPASSSGNKWLPRSNAWWESGSSSQRHKRRNSHHSLPLVITTFPHCVSCLSCVSAHFLCVVLLSFIFPHTSLFVFFFLSVIYRLPLITPSVSIHVTHVLLEKFHARFIR